jgi:hypothetical protein
LPNYHRHPLEGCFERVRRADEHLIDLKARIEIAFAQQANAIGVEFDPNPPYSGIRLTPSRETFFGMSIGIRIGEVCYNLRSAPGPSVYWPLLDFGTLDSIVNIAELQAHELLVNYKHTILTAVQQVDDAVASYGAAQQRLKDLNRALGAARRSTRLATEQYDRGLTDYLNVLDAERQEFDLEEQYVTTQQRAAEQLITLYKALGGGWELHQFIPPIRQPQPAIIAAARRLLSPDQTR